MSRQNLLLKIRNSVCFSLTIECVFGVWTMTTTLTLFVVLACLGAFDTLYYHEWRARLPAMGPLARSATYSSTRSATLYTLQARTRHRGVTDEGDCGDGSGCGNGRGEAGGAARAAGGDKRRRCSDSCIGIHRG